LQREDEGRADGIFIHLLESKDEGRKNKSEMACRAKKKEAYL